MEGGGDVGRRLRTWREVSDKHDMSMDGPKNGPQLEVSIRWMMKWGMSKSEIVAKVLDVQLRR